MLASIERDRGKVDESLARLRALEQRMEEMLPPDHPARVNTLIELGKTKLAARDCTGAVASARQALALLQRNDAPPDQPAEAGFLIARALGPRDAEAVTLAEQALTTFEDLGSGYASEADEVRTWLITSPR